MSNSCKKETANRSMRQVCYAQSCYDLFTTACRNSVSNSTVAALSHQFVADLFPTALLQFCQNSFVADLTRVYLKVEGRESRVNVESKKSRVESKKSRVESKKSRVIVESGQMSQERQSRYIFTVDFS